MKLQGQPNQLVHKRALKRGEWRVVEWFRFDAQGVAELDDTKVCPTDKLKLERLFGGLNQVAKAEMSDEEIRALAKERGIKSWHTKSITNLKKELEV